MRAWMGVVLAAAAWAWAASAMAQGGNYQVQPGDTLRIEVLEDNNLDRQVLVLPDGRFSFPLAGTVLAGGRTISQVERSLSSALAPNFNVPPTVFVSVAGLAERPEEEADADGETIIVYLLGEVNDPGPKTVLEGTTLLQMLAQGGGFTPFAATKRLQLRRTDPRSGAQDLVIVNYRAISRGARIRNEPVLQEGDVLLVPERRLFE